MITKLRLKNFRCFKDITLGGLGRLVVIDTNDNLVYFLRGDGRMLTLLLDAQEEIIGWSEFQTDGFIGDIVLCSIITLDMLIYAPLIGLAHFHISRVYRP